MFKGFLPEGTYHVVVMNRNFTNAHLLYDDKFEDARIDIARMMANRFPSENASRQGRRSDLCACFGLLWRAVSMAIRRP